MYRRTLHALLVRASRLKWRIEGTVKPAVPHMVTPEARGCRENERLIQELSIPAPGSQPLHFETRYPQSALSQFKLIFWKCAALPSRPLAVISHRTHSYQACTTDTSEYDKGAP